MHRARHQFLAGAAFSGDQDRRLGRRHLPDHREHLLHRGAGAHDIDQNALIRKLPLQALGFLRQTALRRGALQQNFQSTGLNRLFEKPERAQVVHGLHRRFDIPESGQHDGGRHVALCPQTFQKLKSIHAGHH